MMSNKSWAETPPQLKNGAPSLKAQRRLYEAFLIPSVVTKGEKQPFVDLRGSPRVSVTTQ